MLARNHLATLPINMNVQGDKLMNTRRLFTLFLFIGFLCAQFGFAQTVAGLKKRPKIGLVLSGGGARGIAHIGVLEWFEKNQIPVDYIVGTSMGGIVGGLYATGKTPAELRKIIEEIDWDEVLQTTPAYDEMSFRRKQDRRENQNVIEFGLKNGIRIPSGLNSGHKVGLVFDRLTLSYPNMETFDDLVIPYRAVATDMVKGEAVILESGSLSTAMRATMAIPGVFTPVEREGKILADGGLVNNIPTDIAKQMGADIVIAVDIGTPLSTDPKTLESLGGVLSQSIGVALIGNDRRNLALADIIIAPDLGTYTLFDFKSGNQIYELGYKGAEAKSAVLKNLSLDGASWAEYTAQKNARRKGEVPDPQSLAVTTANLPEVQVDALKNKLENNVGKPIDSPKLERELNKIRGEGRLETLGYGVNRINDSNTLTIRAAEKSSGPIVMTPNFRIETGGENEVFTTLGGRFTFFDIGGFRSELRADLKFGSETVLAGELYKPIGKTGFFIAPRLYYDSRIRSFFNDTVRIADYRVKRFGAGIDTGYTFRQSEIRFGFDLNHINAAPRLGDIDLNRLEGNQKRIFARYELDTTNDSIVPTKGFRAYGEGRYFFNSPGALSGFPQAEGGLIGFHPLGKKGIVFAGFSGGTTFDRNAAPTETFQLGGIGRLGAYRRNEFSGNNFVLTQGGYLREIYTLPSVIGGKVYLLGGIESGGAFNKFDWSRHYTNVTGSIIVVTSLGPVMVGTSFGEGGKGKIYFSLGKVF